jgi:hypothetical protein
MRLAAFGRVELPLGEALRLEFADDTPGSSEQGNLQYYISTDAGPWALWLSCPRDELEAAEDALHRLEYPLT